MPGQKVLEDTSKISALDQKIHKTEKIGALIGGFAILSLIPLAVISVGGRNFFNQPIPGYIDWIEQILPLIAFMGIAYTQRQGAHIRMDIFVAKLKKRTLWICEAITTTAILAATLVLIWGSFAHFQRSVDTNAPLWSRDSSIDIAIPLWPAKLIVPIAFSILALRLIIQIAAYIKAAIKNDPKPSAVPLIEDAAAQAKRETEGILKQEKQ